MLWRPLSRNDFLKKKCGTLLRPAFLFSQVFAGWTIFPSKAAAAAAAGLARKVLAWGLPMREPLLLNIAVVWRKDVFITREARQFIRFMKSRIA